jgi:hypothetical protein
VDILHAGCIEWRLTDDVQVVMAMYQSRDDAQRRQINAFMTAFQEHPQSWTRVSLSHRGDS